MIVNKVARSCVVVFYCVTFKCVYTSSSAVWTLTVENCNIEDGNRAPTVITRMLQQSGSSISINANWCLEILIFFPHKKSCLNSSLSCV